MDGSLPGIGHNSPKSTTDESHAELQSRNRSTPATGPVPELRRMSSRRRLRANREWMSYGDPLGIFLKHQPTLTTLEDHWEELNKINKKIDESMCSGWKDEVEKLLIFAGLFSAVVTSFTTESYRWLQPDPVSTSNLLLEGVLQRLSNPQAAPHNITISSSINTFNPAAWAIRVNIVWFLSLSLALTTALVGILCIQWFREYQRYPSGHQSTKDIFTIRQMRLEGLERWHVPEIMAALPLLLQSALVLFFVGLLDLLWNIQPTVAVITSVLIGVTLLFLVFTTALPMVQFLFHTATLRLVPQCPYKSPQSWLFYRLGTILSGILYPVVTYACGSPDEDSDPAGEIVSWRDFIRRLKNASKMSDWIQYDTFWRKLRSNIPSRFGKSHIDRQNGLLSFAKGLLKTDKAGCFYVYRCLEEISAEQQNDANLDISTSSILYEMIDRVEPWYETVPSLQHLPLSIGRDMIRFLSTLHPPSTIDPTTVLNYQRELFIRMLNSISANRLRGESDDGTHPAVVTELLEKKVINLFYTDDRVPSDILTQGFRAVARKVKESHNKNIPWSIQRFFACLFCAGLKSGYEATGIEGEGLHSSMSYACETVQEWLNDPVNSSNTFEWAQRFTFYLGRKMDEFRGDSLYLNYKPFLEEIERIRSHMGRGATFP